MVKKIIGEIAYLIQGDIFWLAIYIFYLIRKLK